jgi:hypothetical protein
MSLGHGAKVVTDNIDFYVDAANTKSYAGSGTTWYDLNNNRNLSSGGCTWNSAGYFSLDGSNDTASLTFTMGTDKTVNMWIRQSTGTSRGLLHRSDWRERIFQTAVTLIASDGTYLTLSFPTSLTAGGLHNVCYTVSGLSAKVYIDGEQVVSGTLSSFLNTGSYTYYFGYQCSGSTCTYQNGELHAISYYDAALTAEQVKQNFEALRGRFGL